MFMKDFGSLKKMTDLTPSGLASASLSDRNLDCSSDDGSLSPTKSLIPSPYFTQLKGSVLTLPLYNPSTSAVDLSVVKKMEENEGKKAEDQVCLLHENISSYSISKKKN